jgi:hypothetical protein
MKRLLVVLIFAIFIMGCSSGRNKVLEIQALRECEVIENEEYFFIKSSNPNSYVIFASNEYVSVMAGDVSELSSDGNTTSIVIYPVEDFSVVKVLKSGVK